jgi:hypothetical protein
VPATLDNSHDQSRRSSGSTVWVALICLGTVISACGERTTILELPDETGGSGGGGGGSSCPEYLRLCDDRCVDTAVDPENCGDCRRACEDGQRCEAAACVLDCPPGLLTCDDTCIDPNTSNEHCGASGDCSGATSGATCAPGFVCDGTGHCEVTCQRGLVACDGVCTDPLNNEQHCGAGADCGADPGLICGPGEVCDGTGQCALSCQSGVECDGECVDPLNDEDHCGAGPDCAANPGTVCGPSELCDGAGQCALSCQVGLTDCGGNCTDTAVDPDHCGGCDSACLVGPQQSTYCAGSMCHYVCDPGRTDCDGLPETGCEVDLMTDADHCGACDVSCFAGCALGVCDKRVFVTSSVHDGNLGGVPGADAMCQAHADAAALGGTYLAWISVPGNSPDSRFAKSAGRYVLVNGTVIADDWLDLTDASIDHPLDVTETGGVASSVGLCTDLPEAWSGTAPDGTEESIIDIDNCDGWTTTMSYGYLYTGILGATDGQWSDGCTSLFVDGCERLLPIYCFEQ